MPEDLPSWLSEADLSFMVEEFRRSGFRGPINWYRNIDRNWEITPFLNGAKILQPTPFLAGALDVALNILVDDFESLESQCAQALEETSHPRRRPLRRARKSKGGQQAAV